MSKNNSKSSRETSRASVLQEARNMKMARSAHAYVRGSTAKFYEWLGGLKRGSLPEGPAIWICGDCHIGNLGPIADATGKIDVQIRDLDQTVIGNPAHDLIRLGLSLASAARGSDLPGVMTAKMMEQLIDGYESAFGDSDTDKKKNTEPESVELALRKASRRTWKHLAEERIEDAKPSIPLGERFWAIEKAEKTAIKELFQVGHMRTLATMLRSRDDDAPVEILDAAYWMKGCSSLGLLRYAVLLSVGKKRGEVCLMDIKEAVTAVAPRYSKAKMPSDNGERVVEGGRHLSPYIGERMRSGELLNKSVFVRELLPQDLKLDIEQFSRDEAQKVAGYLGKVVGRAHARQMDDTTRKLWSRTLGQNRSKSLDAPSWLWTSIVDLMAIHERAYLEHCRRYATAA